MKVDLIGYCNDINDNIKNIKDEIIEDVANYKNEDEVKYVLSALLDFHSLLFVKMVFVMAIFKQEEINKLTNNHTIQNEMDDFWKNNNMHKDFTTGLGSIYDSIEGGDCYKIQTAIEEQCTRNGKFVDKCKEMCEIFNINTEM